MSFFSLSAPIEPIQGRPDAPARVPEALSSLSDHLLRDIGMERREVDFSAGDILAQMR